jgi:hypothetical protein
MRTLIGGIFSRWVAIVDVSQLTVGGTRVVRYPFECTPHTDLQALLNGLAYLCEVQIIPWCISFGIFVDDAIFLVNSRPIATNISTEMSFNPLMAAALQIKIAFLCSVGLPNVPSSFFTFWNRSRDSYRIFLFSWKRLISCDILVSPYFNGQLIRSLALSRFLYRREVDALMVCFFGWAETHFFYLFASEPFFQWTFLFI